jgi:hypothetical protein
VSIQREIWKSEEVDLEHLLRLRLAVARFGEMDNARWWNTNGLLGRLGGLALKRGLPKSHDFAQARVVFAIAATRCQQIFDPPGCMTLWHLPATLEDSFQTSWETWIEQYEQWGSFFQKLQGIQGTDLLGAMLDLEIITNEEAEEARKLRRAADNRAVPLPGVHRPSRQTVTMLAAGFFRGEPSQPAVPYARSEEV